MTDDNRVRIYGEEHDDPTLSTSLADFDTVFVDIPGTGVIQIGDYDDTEGVTVNYVDHAAMVIEGSVKDNPKVTLRSNEFPTRVAIDDRENAFRRCDDDA